MAWALSCPVTSLRNFMIFPKTPLQSSIYILLFSLFIYCLWFTSKPVTHFNTFINIYFNSNNILIISNLWHVMDASLKWQMLIPNTFTTVYPHLSCYYLLLVEEAHKHTYGGKTHTEYMAWAHSQKRAHARTRAASAVLKSHSFDYRAPWR